MALDEVDMAFAWWRQTSGPRRLLRKLTSNSLRGLCSATSNIADENFLEVFAAGIMEEDSAVIIDHEQVDENTSDDDFLHTLLDKYASPDYVIDLLSDSPFLDMAAKGALKHRIIFVTFCGRCSWAAKIGAAYNKGAAKAANSGALIFLTDWLDDDFPSGCGVDRLSIADYVTTYDYQSYAAHLLAERGMKDGGKRIYTAGLTAAIAAPCNDFSLVPALALPQLYREPLETARRILSDNFVEEQVLRNLWEMQMQTVMPITENFRQKLIRTYEKTLARILLNPVEDDFGNILTEPLDMELRHLRYYGASEKCFSYNDWETLSFMCDVRNKLAHLKTLTTEELDRVFAL